MLSTFAIAKFPFSFPPSRKFVVPNFIANALSFIKNAFQKTLNFRTKFKTISAFYDVTGMMLVKLFPKTNYYGEKSTGQIATSRFLKTTLSRVVLETVLFC
jgi:hypothetical protein